MVLPLGASKAAAGGTYYVSLLFHTIHVYCDISRFIYIVPVYCVGVFAHPMPSARRGGQSWKELTRGVKNWEDMRRGEKAEESSEELRRAEKRGRVEKRNEELWRVGKSSRGAKKGEGELRRIWSFIATLKSKLVLRSLGYSVIRFCRKLPPLCKIVAHKYPSYFKPTQHVGTQVWSMLL